MPVQIQHLMSDIHTRLSEPITSTRIQILGLQPCIQIIK